MDTTKSVVIILIVLLVLSSLFFAGGWFLTKRQLDLEIAKEQTRENILSFTSLFISKVVSASGDVSFEDRLKLENAVRTINDQQIFNEWEKLTSAKDQTQARQELNIFLQLLVDKASK